MEVSLSVVAIVISAASAAFSLYTFAWTAARDRKQATLDAYNRLQQQALDKLNGITPSQMREIAQDPKAERYKEISGYIARLEHFCVGVNRRIYDRRVVWALAHGYLDGAIKSRIEPILERKNRYGEQEYYNNIRKLYAWMEHKSKQGRGVQK